MADLASLSDLQDYMGVDAGVDDMVLQDMLDRTESILERETNRTFTTGETITDETQDGNGTEVIYTDRPISSLTEVKIGTDVNDPDETLSDQPDDVDVDDDRVIRRDGGVWPRGIANIHVTYDAGEFLPDIATQAVLEGTAYLYRRRGKEHAASRSVGEFGSVEMAALFNRLPVWQRAVTHLRVPVVA